MEPRTTYDRTSHDTGALNQVKMASGLNLIAGLWLIISPFVLGYTDLNQAMWNSLIVGILVAAMAAARVAMPGHYPWMSWANVVLGIWLIASPFVFSYPRDGVGETAMWNEIVMGIIVAGLGLWSASRTHVDTDVPQHTPGPPPGGTRATT